MRAGWPMRREWSPMLSILPRPDFFASASSTSTAARVKLKKSSAVEKARPGANLESLVHSVYGTTRCHVQPPSAVRTARQ